MAVIPSTNVNLATNIRDVLNAAGGSVGNDVVSFFTSEAKINKWSFYKPVRYAKNTRLTLDEIKTTYCGMSPSANTALLYACCNYSGTQVDNNPSAVVSGQKEWTYALPTGGSSQPYRLSDFTNTDGVGNGYKTDAAPPDSGWSNVSYLKDTLQTAITTNIESTVGENQYDWSIDLTTLPFYSNFNCKIDIQSWAGIGSNDNVEIPITYITGDRLITSEYWRLGIAVYIPSIASTGKWQLFVSRYPLKSSAISSDMNKILPSLATNTLAIRQMLTSGQTSFDCIPCLVKNVALGSVAYSTDILNSYVLLDTTAVVYSVPSGQGLITMSIHEESAPSVSGFETLAYSPNRKWIIGRRKISTAGSDSTMKNVYGLGLIYVSGTIPNDIYVNVSFTYSVLQSVASTTSTNYEKTINKTISAGTTETIGDMQINGLSIASGLEATVNTSTIVWSSY